MGEQPLKVPLIQYLLPVCNLRSSVLFSANGGRRKDLLSLFTEKSKERLIAGYSIFKKCDALGPFLEKCGRLIATSLLRRHGNGAEITKFII